MYAIDISKHEEHLSSDKNSSFFYFEVEKTNDKNGHVSIEVCAECLYSRTICLHTKTQWNENNSKLLCKLCGDDVT